MHTFIFGPMAHIHVDGLKAATTWGWPASTPPMSMIMIQWMPASSLPALPLRRNQSPVFNGHTKRRHDGPTLARNSSCLWVTGTRIQFQLQLLDRNKLAVGFTLRLPRVVQECGVDLLQEYSDLIAWAHVGVTTACPPTGQATAAMTFSAPARGRGWTHMTLCNQHGPVQSAPPIHTWLQRKGFRIVCLKHMAKPNQQIQHKKYWNKKQVTSKTLKLISANSRQNIKTRNKKKHWHWNSHKYKTHKQNDQCNTHQNNRKHKFKHKIMQTSLKLKNTQHQWQTQQDDNTKRTTMQNSSYYWIALET